MDQQSAKLQQEYWENQHQKYQRDQIKTDGWLDEFEDLIINSEGPILDLGAGSGNNLLFLEARGLDVIACDFSENALENIQENFSSIVRTECFDMTEGLPFPDGFTDLVIADLSLHYFPEKTTFQILNEIKRVLTPGGDLLFRVNSMNDTHYGAGTGEEIEHHYYFTGTSSYKRFFDFADLEHFFQGWTLDKVAETPLYRYDHPKMVWKGHAAVRDSAQEKPLGNHKIS